MELSSSPKIFKNYKCDYPKNTIDKIKKAFTKIGLDISYHEKSFSNSGISIYTGYALIDILGWNQQGKGLSSILSKASAYAELAERFSTGFMQLKIPLPVKHKKFTQILQPINEKRYLKGFTDENVFEVENIQNINKFFSEKISKEKYDQYKNEGLLKNKVNAFSLINNKDVKIPIAIIELHSMSNGLASGNTMEEAIAQASFEIFERHAGNKIISNKKICPSIDESTIDNKEIRECLRFFKYLNIEVILKDFTLNNKIPVIAAIFINKELEKDRNKLRKDRDYIRIEIGSHIYLEEAIIRCFTEYIQGLKLDREQLKKQQYDDLYYSWIKTLNKKYIGVKDEFKYFTRLYDYHGDFSFLLKGEKISFQNLKSTLYDDSYSDVKKIKSICIENNWDCIVVDFTHKILKFPTVRVIIPPISLDFDLFLKRILDINDQKLRINNFYGINNFYDFLTNDKWLNNEKRISMLIKNIESYLSNELSYYCISLTRENNFFQNIYLFDILPYLYLSISDYENAEKYFKSLIKINYKPDIKSTFLYSQYQKKYNPEIYKRFLRLIKEKRENNEKYCYKLEKNPFDPEIIQEDLEKECYDLLKNVGDSYF